ncbi:DUF771 domain-containing protein [Pseudobacillus sp. 179-B 2D1 NHS]|uniref:DUF771 domain-containing protein n=1 Tax=Pseudobacillus sp. 179-B 2D1 NHS TaxID=3374292 RepID=UPI003878F884
MQIIEITVPIQIPDNLIVIEKNLYKQLQENQEQGEWWTLEDVLKRVKVSRKTFSEKILNNHKYRKQLESFVHYPSRKGGKYYFLASETKKFLETNFKSITNGISGGNHD